MTVAVEPQTPPAEDLPKILMIVGNDVTIDTRVRKVASTVASTGLPVTVLGLSPTGLRTEAMMGPVRVVRVPVLWKLRDAARQRQRKARSRITLGYESKEAYIIARRKQVIREREAQAAAGRWRTRAEAQRALGATPTQEALLQAERAYLKAWRTSLKVRRKIQQSREGMYRRNAVVLAGERARERRSLQAALEWLPRRRGWRHLLPEINDYELAFGPVIDELEPDVIHAHDVHLVGVAARAAARARAKGREVRWIYDAHEYVPGLARYNATILSAYSDLEREYIGSADRVITVSDPLAEILQRAHGLPRQPAVVMNIPIRVERSEEGGPSLRQAAGLAENVPIMVYSGGIHHSRGVETCVRALPYLPGVHLVFVSNQVNRYIESLAAIAAEAGCTDRLHFVPFVAPDQVSTYLASATVALNPLLHYGNYEVALPNKYFEYLHAGLPIANSDVQATAEMTRRTGFGEVFVADEEADLARAVRTILGDRDTYVKRIVESDEVNTLFTWRHQEEVLVDLYRELLGLDLRVGAAVASLDEGEGRLTGRAGVAVAGKPLSLAIGPRNMAGQGWAWAKALEVEYANARTEVFTIAKSSPLLFPTDTRIPSGSWKSLEWQLSQVRHLVSDFTHVLYESGSGLCGSLYGGFFTGELPMLRAQDIPAGIVLHGSEIRDPRRHRELEPNSPFAGPEDRFTLRIQEAVDRVASMIEEFDGPVYVTTMDLLDYVPRATWLPVVVDLHRWRSETPALQRARPVVLHVPSQTRIKGSQTVDEVANALAAEGRIEYRRTERVPVDEMPRLVAEADVVLDQFGVGDYGVAACEAMAASRVVVGHVADRVRDRLPGDLPIVEATPDSLREVLLDVVGTPERYRERAEAGRRYVQQWHDGRYAVRQLGAFLGLETDL